MYNICLMSWNLIGRNQTYDIDHLRKSAVIGQKGNFNWIMHCDSQDLTNSPVDTPETWHTCLERCFVWWNSIKMAGHRSFFEDICNFLSKNNSGIKILVNPPIVPGQKISNIFNKWSMTHNFSSIISNKTPLQTRICQFSETSIEKFVRSWES